jgi:hypothetical protein
MPTSGEDLESMGQKINGIFLVNNVTIPNATLDVVFCNFNPSNKNGNCELIFPVTNLINFKNFV